MFKYCDRDPAKLLSVNLVACVDRQTKRLIEEPNDSLEAAVGNRRKLSFKRDLLLRAVVSTLPMLLLVVQPVAGQDNEKSGKVQESNENQDIDIAMRALIKSAHDDDEKVRMAAIDVLGSSTTHHREILITLGPFLSDENSALAKQAEKSFLRLPCEQKLKLLLLTSMLESRNLEVVEVAKRLIDTFVVDETMIRAIDDLLGSDMTSKKTRAFLFQLIQRWGQKASPMVPTLVKLFENDSWKAEVLKSWESIGPGAKDALPMITIALSDDQPNVRLLAVQALGSVTNARAVKYNSARQNSVDGYVQHVFAQADADQDQKLSVSEVKNSPLGQATILYDKNRDGFVEEGELYSALYQEGNRQNQQRNSSNFRRRRSRTPEATYSAYVDSVMNLYDRNKDGKLDKEEITKMSRPPTGADQDSDGRLTHQELVNHYSGQVRK